MLNHLSKFLFNVLKANGISITYQTIEKNILTHPEYPSMQSISDAFDSWMVKHVVMKLSLEKLHALNVPVIDFAKRNLILTVTE